MADNLVGLFDSDPGFLEELASGTDDQSSVVAQSQTQLQGLMPANVNIIQHGLTQYNIGSTQPGTNYGNIQYQNQPQQQQQFGQQGFTQYNNQQMFTQNLSGANQGHVTTMMSPAPGMNPMMQTGQVMFQYNAGGTSQMGPRLPSPGQPQQINVAQIQSWNPSPQLFNQQQQSYLTQHDYAVPISTSQQMHVQQQQQQFPSAQSQQNQTIYIQRMAGPGNMNRIAVTAKPQMYQHISLGNAQNFGNVVMSQTNVLPQQQSLQFISKQSGQQQAGGQFQSGQQQAGGQFQSGQQQAGGQFQSGQQQAGSQFQSGQQQAGNQFQTGQQQTGSQFQTGQQQAGNQFQQFTYNSSSHLQQQTMGDNCLNSQANLIGFAQASPNVPFNNMGTMSQQRPNIAVSSPRPTPPPPSVTPGLLSPTGSTSSLQGGFTQIEPTMQQSQLQQTNACANLFQQSVSSDTGTVDKNSQNFQFSQTLNQIRIPGQQAAVKVIANVKSGIQGQVSPVKNVISPNAADALPLNIHVEIQNASQQGQQQFYVQAQTSQNQQNMLDLQDKYRTMKSQQMQQSPRPGQQQTFQGVQLQQSSGTAPQVLVTGSQMQSQMLNKVSSVSSQMVLPGTQILVPASAPNQANAPQKIFIIQQQGPRMTNTPQQQQQQLPQSQQVQMLTSLPQPILNGSSQHSQQIVIKPNLSTGCNAQSIIIHSVLPASSQSNSDNSTDSFTSQQQEKANKIIAEAIAKAQKSGNMTIPRVLQPPELPVTLGDLDNPDKLVEDKPKQKRKYTPRKEKTPKPKKEKKTKTDIPTTVLSQMAEGDDTTQEMKSELEFEKEEKVKKPKKKREKGEKKTPSEKTPKSEHKKSKKPPATFLKNKKRKKRGSSDGSDVEIKITPPPSPENDEFKRRSGRNIKRKKYMDDVDLNLSEEETSDILDVGGFDNEGAVVKPVLFVENPAEEDAVIVDKILGCRMRKNDPDVDGDEEEVEEYFVKYKNFSYLHCEWKTEVEIKDKRIPGKIRRFKMKKMNINDIFLADEELFNPDYVEVDRVLEESKTIDPNTQEEVTHYLVKWRSLPYEDSTWELQQDVDPEKVKQFRKFRELPPENERRFKPRPKPSDWEALRDTHMYKNDNTLREYQLEGVNWLRFNWYKRQNCILADEMGLGKTIQSIALLQEMSNYGIKGPFLVVAPLSTIANWQREFETWTDINAITYHGTSPSRYMLQEYEMYYRDEEGNKYTDFYKFHAIITTYEIVLSDLELLRSIKWRCIIIDEAHRLKNKNCSLIKCLRCFDFDHKVLLSGTPLQNNVEELFSLLNFLEPNQFSSSEAFLVEFGTLHTEEQVDKLKAILKPMMLRRLKEDVEKNLARKEETIIEVELTNIQKKYYRAILEKNFSYLCKGANSTNVPSLLNTMMELRKCCNHPYLLNGAEENILAELRAKDGREPEHIQALIQASGKFVLLDKLLPKLKQNGHRILIFSQMIRVLDIIEDYLIHKKYLYERLDGRIRGNLRQEAIDRYSKPDSDRFVFLICTKAGGLGINLTAADTVVIYDSDWNPQNDLQAQARCHRIGQSKMVKVYRLITRNSYEREMFNRASMKLGLDKAVLQSMAGEKVNAQQQLSKREIEDLLRKGAYGALMDDDNAGDKFCEEDIEQILKGRTQVIEIESEGKGSTFSKASFSLSTNREDIDINDPEFWQKWAKKAEVDTDSLETRELIVDEPRVRKRTTRYGNNDNLAEMSDLGSESDSDEDESKKGRKGRRSRRGGGDDDDDFEKERHRAKTSGSGYGRSELFKVEKGLLHYGWGRWSDILSHSRFKRPMEEKDVENVAKAILLYGLQYYKGDERIKEFISDLISQEKDGGLKNHSGLSAPVPRGRKGKKAKSEEIHFDANEEIEKAGIKMDRDIIYNKNAYKRHIHRHSNKVLLRVRTLYYLKHEVLGDVVEQIDQGLHIKDINLAAPVADDEPPTYWWDELADKSLLVGVYKHGYEKYNLMRQDPLLIFLERCGPPDGAALAAEMKDNDENENDDDEASILKDLDEEESLTCSSDVLSTPKRAPPPVLNRTEGEDGEVEGELPFPSVSEINTRLRRIITNYQRDYKKQQLKKEQQAKKMEKRERLDAVFREREVRRKETLMKWTRKEETEFYRVVSTYGIEFDRHKGRYIWDKFRVMARLEKKTDEQLTEYFISFYHMCLRVCRKIKEEAYPPTPVYIEPITEERANRCIARIDLLSKIREEIVVHAKMDQRIKLCKPSLDLPSWWVSGKHDRELLIGAARHGLARTDYYIMSDSNLSFFETVQGFINMHSNSPANGTVFDKESDKKDIKEEYEDIKIKVSEETNIKTENKLNKTDSVQVKTEIDENLEDISDKEIEQTKKCTKIDHEEQGDKISSQVNKDVVKKDDDEINGSFDESESKKVIKEAIDKKILETKRESVEKQNHKAKIPKVKDDNTESDQKVDDLKVEVKKEQVIKQGLEEMDIKEDADEEVQRTLEGDELHPDLCDNISQNLLAQWPKDRIVFHRLEQICYCIETGDWPFPPKMKNVHILGIDSTSTTPTRSMTPQTPKPDEDVKESAEKGPKKDKDFEVQLADGQGLKMTFHKKHERSRKPVDSHDSEKAARIQAILAQSLAASQASSDDSQQESVASGSTLQVSWPPPWLHSPPPFTMVPPQGGAGESPFLNGGHLTEEEMVMNRHLVSELNELFLERNRKVGLKHTFNPFLNDSNMSPEEMFMNRHMFDQGLLFPRAGRRGRKRKEEKMAEIAMAEALARRQTARALTGLEPESRVAVINLEDGSRLSGEDAPRKKDLDLWLKAHPGYVVDSRVEDLEEGEILPDFPERRKGRKPKFDPAFLEVEKLTGEENVSVINRLTGKKITGAKAPPLRFLAEWLEQNPMWDVDPKWAELVRAKGSLPKTLLPRIVTPSRRGRRPRDSPISHSMLGASDPHQAAAIAASMEAMNAAQLMAGFGKLPLPFGPIPGMGLNPLLALPGFGFPGLSPSPVSEKSDSKSKDSKGSKEDCEKTKDDDGTASPHPSFPMLFNPLLYNPALLAAHGLANFQLAGLDPSLLNGHTKPKEDASNSRSSPKSHKVTELVDQAEDLSVKSKSKAVIENTMEAHSSGKAKLKTDVSFDSDDMPCDLSMKPKSKEEKSKQKICSSDKLSRIVDTLKFRVNKMDEITPKIEGKESEWHSLEMPPNLKEKHIDPVLIKKESSSFKKDHLNYLSHKSSTPTSLNHLKEPVPKIVQELLAAKEQRERAEFYVAKQHKQDAFAAKHQKLCRSVSKEKPSIAAQGLDTSVEKDSGKKMDPANEKS